MIINKYSQYNHFWICLFGHFKEKGFNRVYLSLLASLSDSRRVKISPSRTGPLTFLMIWRFCSPKNSTRTWVHWPWDPVRPRILMTRAKVTDLSMLVVLQVEFEKMKKLTKMQTRQARTVFISWPHVFQETRSKYRASLPRLSRPNQCCLASAYNNFTLSTQRPTLYFLKFQGIINTSEDV